MIYFILTNLIFFSEMQQQNGLVMAVIYYYIIIYIKTKLPVLWQSCLQTIDDGRHWKTLEDTGGHCTRLIVKTLEHNLSLLIQDEFNEIKCTVHINNIS